MVVDRRDAAHLQEKRNLLMKQKQSVAVEREKFYIESELKRIDAEETIDREKLAVFFMRTFEETGRATAIRSDGVRKDARPHVTGEPIQDFWNLRSECYNLANWQTY